MAARATCVSFSPVSKSLKPFHLLSFSIVLIKVVMVKQVGRDGFLKFAIVLYQLANILNSLFRQVLSLIWGYIYVLKRHIKILSSFNKYI